MQDSMHFKVGIQFCSEFPSCTPEEFELQRFTLPSWQQADTHRTFRNAHYPHAIMLNLDECGRHNISPNFGIQRMKRFRRSLARKIAFHKSGLAVWTGDRTGVKTA
jgi:hypothetical protein